MTGKEKGNFRGNSSDVMSSAIKFMANDTAVPTVAGVSKQLKKSTKGKPQPQSTSQATLSNENDKEPGV